jgi:Lrp/AsnC family leucine-responsive transcriptional regulator
MKTHRPESVDDINWNILAALQSDARLSFSDLGRRVGLTAPAVAERVRRLEEAGVITGYRAVLNPEKLGRPIRAMIRVSAPEEHCQRLGGLVRELPAVLESHRVTGPDRLILKVAVPSVGDLDAVLKELSRYGTATASVILSSAARAVGRPGQINDAQR